MPIYTGTTRDGSDMQEAEGVYVSPDGEEWSSTPYSTVGSRTWDEVYNHLVDHRHSMNMERDLILQKRSLLSKRCRDYLIKTMAKAETK